MKFADLRTKIGLSKKNFAPDNVKDMVRLLGNDFFKVAMEKTLAGLGDSSLVLPLDDRELLADGSEWQKIDPAMTELLQDRWRLREFCRQKGLETPKGMVAEKFEQLSQWIIKNGSFPIALKPRKNTSGGMGIYRLEGFRELPGFYEKIQELYPGPVLAEKWIESRALIEVTIGPRGGQLFTQLGMEKSLIVRPSWRSFPINPPLKFKEDLEKILSIFSCLLQHPGIIVRFTVAVTEKSTILISVNGGANRLEYYPGWGDKRSDGSIIERIIGKSPPPRNSKPGYSWLQMLHSTSKSRVFPSELPAAVTSFPIENYFPAGNRAVILIYGTSPKILQENSRIIKDSFRTLATKE